MDCGSEGLAHGPFFERQSRREAKNLVGPNHDIAGERAVDAVAHATALGTKHELALAAIEAAAAGDRGGAQHTKPFPGRDAAHVLTDLNNRGPHLVAEDHWRKTSEIIVVNVKIGAADAAPGDFEFDLVGPARRFIDIADLHVTRASCEFYQGFHCGGERTAVWLICMAASFS